MKPPDRPAGDYPHRVLESTRGYVEELLGELASIKSQLAASEEERAHLKQQLRELRVLIDSQRSEHERVENEKRRILTESEELATRFSEIERQNSDLANLYVASYQLHGSVERNDVLQAIREIVINLVGSEQFALYRQEGGELTLLTAFGARANEIPLDQVRRRGLDRSLENNEVLVESEADPASPLLACVPLRLGDRVVGGLVIFELLGHKAGLEHIDYELFDLLAAHAAPALYLAELHAARQG